MSIESIKEDYATIAPLIEGCGINWGFHRSKEDEIVVRLSDNKGNDLKLVYPNLDTAVRRIPGTIGIVKTLLLWVVEPPECEEW